ncbi:MAG: hypothetical protein VX392_01575 [Verrucomicrobiota bacterium]|nr:hypothetical protein [Verrucomicrobiota bacterium]
MKTIPFTILTAALLTFSLPAIGADKDQSAWEDSIVRFDVTRNDHNFRVPWDKRPQTVSKLGAVIDNNEVLTTAQGLANHTLVRLQKGGRGRWFDGEVKWVDYQANLAVVHVDDEAFWSGLEPVQFAEADQLRDNLQVVRWRAGNIERRAAEFSRFTVADANFNQAPRIELKASSEIEGAGRGELMVSGEKVIGLVASKSGSTCSVIPAPFITAALRLRADDNYKGLGYFDFIWQPASNPATTEYFELNGPARGVLVIKPFTRPGGKSPLKLHDIILEVDGFPIDIQGDYLDPDYGHVIMEYLACRNKWAGDTVKFKVWRDGETQEVDYPLPKADFTNNLVTDRPEDTEPTYLIAGGLVFVPLSAEYLSSWGKDWQRSAPFRLVFYNNQKPEKAQRSLVVLSLVLPDFYNIGYQERNAQNLVLDTANGHRIDTLESLANALKSPSDSFHVLEFKKGSALRKIILDADTLEEANQRIAKRYRITKMRKLN